MAYANFQQLLNDIAIKFPNNTDRLITEPVMRQFQADLATFFDLRIIDWYNIQQADDTDYIVGAVNDGGLYNITDSVLVLPPATTFHQVICPENVKAGNHLWIYANDSPTEAFDVGRFYWMLYPLPYTPYQLDEYIRPGANLVLWLEDGQPPVIMFMGYDSRLNVVRVTAPIQTTDLTLGYLDEAFGFLKYGQSIHFESLSDAPQNLAIVFRTETGWAINLSTNKL